MNDERKTDPEFRLKNDPPGQWGVEARRRAACARADAWAEHDADLARARETVQSLKNALAPAAPRGGMPDCDDPAKVAARIRESMHALRATFGGANEGEREVAARAARLLHELLGWLPSCTRCEGRGSLWGEDAAPHMSVTCPACQGFGVA